MQTIIRRIGVVGAGVIGSSWAAFYASKGLEVKLYDIDPAFRRKGLRMTSENIEALREGGMLSAEAAEEARNKVTTSDDLNEAVADVQWVQESAAENYETKQKLFGALDEAASPDAVLASSSSGLLMTEIQKHARHPERCLIAHPFNPPHLIPLVELVPGAKTGPETVSAAKSFFERLGKVPVVLKKEAPGHIANRLAAALWREATDIVLRGVASVEDVDRALSAGLGLRYALMGQHLIYHLGGGEGGMAHFIEHLGPAFERWWRDMADWTSLPPHAKEALVRGVQEETGGKSPGEIAKWRDERLIKLLKIIQE